MEIYASKRCLLYIQTVSLLVIFELIFAANVFLSGFLMIAMTIFLFSLAIIGLFIYAPLYFKMLKYTIEKEKIEKKSGVLKQKKEIILISKIQHITTVKTPFSFNCVILIASGSKIVLPFLKKKDLEFFLDFY